MKSPETLPAFEQLTGSVAGLPDPADMTAEQRAGTIKEVHKAQVMLEAYLTTVAGTANTAKDSQLFAAGTTGTMVAALTRQNPVVGAGIVARARALRDMPATQGSYRDGRLSGRHVHHLMQASEHVHGFDEGDGEKVLVDLGCQVEPAALAAVVKVLIEQCLPDAPDEDYRTARERRGLTFTELPDATWRLSGILDPVAGLRLRDAFATVMDPPSPDDRRSIGQRRADALDDIVAAGTANSNPLGTCGLLITADIDTLTDGHGAMLDQLGIGPQLFDLLTCTGILSIILGHNQGNAFVPLMLGRSRRRASAGQWAALIVRDAGCVRCGKTWRYCQAHHIIHWRDGGKTDLSNLCLLCTRCHADLHLGYFSIEMVQDLPEVTIHKTRTRRH